MIVIWAMNTVKPPIADCATTGCERRSTGNTGRSCCRWLRTRATAVPIPIATIAAETIGEPPWTTLSSPPMIRPKVAAQSSAPVKSNGSACGGEQRLGIDRS